MVIGAITFMQNNPFLVDDLILGAESNQIIPISRPYRLKKKRNFSFNLSNKNYVAWSIQKFSSNCISVDITLEFQTSL